MANNNGFQAINQTRISDQVLSQLKNSILKGRFKPGQKLPSERELIETFNVSRAGIREAIRALELTGFVTIRQGPTGGAYVTDPSYDVVAGAYLDLFMVGKVSASELRQARLKLEPEAARLAAINATDRDKTRLRQAMEAETEGPAEGPEEIARNTRIHYIVAEICGNRLYESMIYALLRLTEEIVGVVKPTTTRLHQLSEHGRIVEAIANGDGPAAAAAMADHVTVIGDALSDLEAIYRREMAAGD